jgi:hypothetical protein
LFNPPTPSPAPQRPPQQAQQAEDEDDFDWGGFEDADAAFAEIDHLSQVASSQHQQPVGKRELVPDTSEPSRSRSRNTRFEEDEEFGKSPEPGGTEETVLGPTQRYDDQIEEGHVKKKVSFVVLLSDSAYRIASS